MLATALAPPLVVALSAEVSEAGVSGIGPFVIATGIAGLVSSPVWGRLADRSSRLVIAVASASGGVAALGYLLLRESGLEGTPWLGPAAYLGLAVAHAGARMGRKTYVVDLGRGDSRTRYVAVANTVIGVLLLAAGGVGALVAHIGAKWALALFGVAGLAGALVALRMEEIHQEG